MTYNIYRELYKYAGLNNDLPAKSEVNNVNTRFTYL